MLIQHWQLTSDKHSKWFHRPYPIVILMRVHCRDYLKLKCFNNSIKRFVESNNEVRMESSFRQQLNLSLSLFWTQTHIFTIHQINNLWLPNQWHSTCNEWVSVWPFWASDSNDKIPIDYWKCKCAQLVRIKDVFECDWEEETHNHSPRSQTKYKAKHWWRFKRITSICDLITQCTLQYPISIH